MYENTDKSGIDEQIGKALYHSIVEENMSIYRTIFMEPVQGKYDEPLAVEVKQIESFYPAEEYHQKYLERNPNGYCHIPRELLEP